MGGFIILLSFFAVRVLGCLYEKQLEEKKSSLENHMFSLSKMNKDLIAHQQIIIEKSAIFNQNREANEKSEKKRILTYIRNELVPISTEDIAYMLTENSITYIYQIDGRKSTSNLSLYELYNTLDKSFFFRANRQYIIVITAIDKIIKYGNNQFKILVTNYPDVEIIISKNRAADFRQWLSI